MRGRPLLPFLSPLLALSVIAAACGGGGGEEGADGTGQENGGSSTTSNPAATTSSTPGPPPGPPTTRGPAPEVTVEPIGAMGGTVVLSGEPAYRGVLGQIDPDRNVVAPVALPPAPAAPGIAPLTGLPLDDPAVAGRPALLVKIDNTAKGRPQEALARADLVYEELIEGGFTRLAAVYHTHSPLLGPVRSGRTTDIALLGSLNEPIFAWSGANRVHAALLRRQDFVDLGAATIRNYFRADDRPGTYDLMTESDVLRDLAAQRDAGGAPPPHFEYRDATIGLPASAVAATGASIDFPSVSVEWTWEAATAGWARTQDGSRHVDAQDVPVVARNVVIAEVGVVGTGSVDLSGSSVDEQLFLGTGRGWVLSDG
ncbi:MAG: DUF3048 domain-containing protein, partial [Actinobacteria bacterium]|nr:DUF3048 domain-containing protein [Actinomycetota bacterium]NIT96152.1 DUF3048 domain-containing protein [Actinomycetota bacterium]NIV87809.1 DUF3048 domain-containing protein [Actinomycetota bacterium]NIW29060.1 DUF3048 domain-containing protein [Actinomycetota bacterium]NIX21574.1 DUF3048 domain-containing protein [Actinomycetota bacterium]